VRTVAAKSQYQTIALNSIHESTTNPRRTFDESKLAELAVSLRTQGLIQPITVRPNSDGYEIIAGARRFRAAQLAAFEEISVRIVQLSDEQALEWMLVELSIVGKSFLCLHAMRHIVYM
jgi:ParB family chromosome partitioning protein